MYYLRYIWSLRPDKEDRLLKEGLELGGQEKLVIE